MSVINLDLSKKTTISAFSGNFIFINGCKYTVSKEGRVCNLLIEMITPSLQSGTTASSIDLSIPLEAKYRPQFNCNIPCWVFNNNVQGMGSCGIFSDGSIHIFNGTPNGTFGTTTNNGFQPINVTYYAA